MEYTRNTTRAINNYGHAVCIAAYQAHKAGSGASSIAIEGLGGIDSPLRTTRQADAAINAGWEIMEFAGACGAASARNLQIWGGDAYVGYRAVSEDGSIYRITDEGKIVERLTVGSKVIRPSP